MSDIAIRVENLSKLYRIGKARQRHDTLRDAIADFGLRIANLGGQNPNSEFRNPNSEYIWALKDVSFEACPERSRRVCTGFHPELTGRENIYLNGAILGMKRAEIDRKFDETCPEPVEGSWPLPRRRPELVEGSRSSWTLP